MQQTWDIKRRMDTWLSNEDKWNPQDNLKNGGFSLEAFRWDTTQRFKIAYCIKCGGSESYDPFKMKYADSKCCKAEILPERKTK